MNFTEMSLKFSDSSMKFTSPTQPMRQLRIFANKVKCLIGGVEGASQKCH